MLPKENRLSSDFDFKRVRKYGRSYQSPYFSLAFLKVSDKNPARFGFITSTKVSKSAAKRNRVKRIMRSVIEELLDSMPAEMLIVFWVKAKAAEVEDTELKNSVNKALSNTHLI